MSAKSNKPRSPEVGRARFNASWQPEVVLALLEPRVQAVFSQTLDRLAGVIGTPQPLRPGAEQIPALIEEYRTRGVEHWARRTMGGQWFEAALLAALRHDLQPPGVAVRHGPASAAA